MARQSKEVRRRCGPAVLLLLLAANCTEKKATIEMSPTTATGYFSSLTVTALQIFPETASGPLDLDEYDVGPAGDRRAFDVVSTHGFEAVVVRVPKTGEQFKFSREELQSPGKSFRSRNSELRLRLLRANNEVIRGPLLLFQNGMPLPFFLRNGVWRDVVSGDAEPAVLPVHILGASDSNRRKIEIRFALEVGLALGRGSVAPDVHDDTFYR